MINLKKIGVIHTPYEDKAPFQPVASDNDEEFDKFFIELEPIYQNGLQELDSFCFIYVIFYLNKIKRNIHLLVSPPWIKNRKKVGLFASRSPVRPNPIGLSIVRIKKIVENKIYTSGLDVFDNTPLLDIKPYIKNLDSKSDANYGWLEKREDFDHLTFHINGIPHDY